MMKTIFSLATLLCISFAIYAKRPNVAIYYNQYQNTDGQPYIETYFSLDPTSVTLRSNANQMWQGGLAITLVFEQKGKIIAFDKIQLMSPEMPDSVGSYPVTVQQSRLKLEPGSYTMKIELTDIHSNAQPIELARDIEVLDHQNKLAVSNILLLYSYTPATENSYFGKWGFEMVPIVPAGTYYIPEQITSLPFYFEIANADSAIGPKEPFIVKFALYDNTKQAVLNKFSGFQKASANHVNPVLNTLNITKLPSGFYNLKVEVLNKENQQIGSQQLAFYRSNPNADLQTMDLTAVDVNNTFIFGVRSLDTLLFYVDCVYPTASDAERRIAQNVRASGNIELMQRFFYRFWQERDPLNPEQAWLVYKEKVDYAQREFGTKGTPGYRTDMGRVLLQYGQPSTMERSYNDPSNYPWQIWQYDVLESASTPTQQNRMFVFVDQALSGRNYTLIHSTGLNEISDHKWQYSLQRNTNRGRTVDDTSSPDARDNFGYRVDNNFIIGDHRYWGDR